MRQWLKQNEGLPHIETSAFTGENIESAFKQISYALLEREKEGELNFDLTGGKSAGNMKLKPKKAQKIGGKKGCC